MNTELMTFTCPSCGSRLPVAPSTIAVKCPHCGNEHMVRQSGENDSRTAGYAQCPKCNRNDKVEKVSAITASQTHIIEGTRPVTQVYTDDKGRTQSSTSYEGFTSTQSSALAQRLAPPQKPRSPNKPSRLWVDILSAIAILCTLGFFKDVSTFFLGIVIIAVTFGPVILLLYVLYRLAKAQYPQRLAEYQLELSRYNRASNRYEALYYCYRDDCIYVLGESEFASSSSFKEYIYEPTRA